VADYQGTRDQGGVRHAKADELHFRTRAVHKSRAKLNGAESMGPKLR
jgi:hypothetical protein